MGELTEDAIDALIHIQLGLVINSACILKLVILESVGVDCHIVSMHLLDEGRVCIRDCAMVPIILFVRQ